MRRSFFVGSQAAHGFIDPTQTVHFAFTSLNLTKKKKKNATARLVAREHLLIVRASAATQSGNACNVIARPQCQCTVRGG
jgi:hypothetical protein